MDPKLYRAIASGDSDGFTEMVMPRTDNLAQVRGTEKNTALHLAVRFQSEKIVRFIVHREPSLKYTENKNGDTPLHLAARTGSTEIVVILVNATAEGRDVEARQSLARMVNKKKGTALHDAVRGGHLQVVKKLLQKDMRLALVQNEAEESPLFLALDRRHEDIARCIVETAPECPYDGSDGMNALHLAAYLGYKDVLNIMMTRLPRDSLLEHRDKVGWTPLHYAAYSGESEAIDLLVRRNIELGYLEDDSGMTALHVAAAGGKLDVVKKIEELCPEAFEQTDSIGRTALHFAVLARKSKVVEYILKAPRLKGPEDVTDNEGNTPLHYAVVWYPRYFPSMLRKYNNRSALHVPNQKGVTPHDIFNWEGYNTWVKRTDPVIHARCMENETQRGFQSARRTAMETALSFKKKVKSAPYKNYRGVLHGTNFIVHDRETEAQNEEIIDEKVDDFEETRDVSITMYTLIAAATFGATLQIPGGYASDGSPVLKNQVAFKVFLYADMVAFFWSLISIIFLIGATYRVNEADSWMKYTKKFKIPFVPPHSTYLTISATLIAFIAAMFIIKINVLAVATFLCCAVFIIALYYVFGSG